MSHQYTNIAFISYKREDEEWAKWLQKELEHYKLPTEIRKQNPDMEFAQNPRHVFKDTTDLSGGVLAKAIKEGLDSSKFLIVICSPHAAKSEWVCKEVQDFIDSGREEYIIPFIIDGQPYAKNPENECFPWALKTLAGERELLGININENGRESAAVKVVARLFDLRFDTLWDRFQREEKKRRRRIFGVFIAAILFLLCVIAGGAYAYFEIQKERDKAELETKRANEEKKRATQLNKQLVSANDSISKQKTSLQKAYDDLTKTEQSLAKSNVDLIVKNKELHISNHNLSVSQIKSLCYFCDQNIAIDQYNKANKSIQEAIMLYKENGDNAYIPELEYSVRNIQKYRKNVRNIYEVRYTKYLRHHIYWGKNDYFYMMDSLSITKYNCTTGKVVEKLYPKVNYTDHITWLTCQNDKVLYTCNDSILKVLDLENNVDDTVLCLPPSALSAFSFNISKDGSILMSEQSKYSDVYNDARGNRLYGRCVLGKDYLFDAVRLVKNKAGLYEFEHLENDSSIDDISIENRHQVDDAFADYYPVKQIFHENDSIKIDYSIWNKKKQIIVFRIITRMSSSESDRLYFQFSSENDAILVFDKKRKNSVIVFPKVDSDGHYDIADNMLCEILFQPNSGEYLLNMYKSWHLVFSMKHKLTNNSITVHNSAHIVSFPDDCYLMRTPNPKFVCLKTKDDYFEIWSPFTKRKIYKSKKDNKYIQWDVPDYFCLWDRYDQKVDFFKIPQVLPLSEYSLFKEHKSSSNIYSQIDQLVKNISRNLNFIYDSDITCDVSPDAKYTIKKFRILNRDKNKEESMLALIDNKTEKARIYLYDCNIGDLSAKFSTNSSCFIVHSVEGRNVYYTLCTINNGVSKRILEVPKDMDSGIIDIHPNGKYFIYAPIYSKDAIAPKPMYLDVNDDMRRITSNDKRFKHHGGYTISALSFTSKGNHVIAYDNGYIHYTPSNSKYICKLKLPKDGWIVKSVSTDNTNSYLAAIVQKDRELLLYVWNLLLQNLVGEFEIGHDVKNVKFTKGDKTIMLDNKYAIDFPCYKDIIASEISYQDH